MGRPTAAQLTTWTGGRWFPGEPASLGGFSIDTRSLRPGDLFVALRTERRDGHTYLEQAAAAGACGAIVAEYARPAPLPQLVVPDPLAALQAIAAGHRREFAKPLVGITGSCGKTSTKDLLATLLGDDVLHTEGNLNNYLGLPLTLMRLRACRHAAGVVEIGISIRGEMETLARIAQPDIAIVTTVAAAHLEGLGGTLDDVAREKAMLPAALGPDKVAIIPSACLQYMPFRRLRARTLVVARDDETLRLPGDNYETVRYSLVAGKFPGERRLLLDVPGQDPLRLTLPRLSEGMLSNATLALAAAQLLGVSAHWLQVRLDRWRPGAFRGEVVRIGALDYYVDCYNANPASMRDSVAAFQEIFPNQRRLYLLGCMNELGVRSVELHYELGRSLRLAASDKVCVIGNEAGHLRDGLLAAGLREDQVSIATTLDSARECLESFSTDGGAVLLKGSRGYRLELLLPDAAQEVAHGVGH